MALTDLPVLDRVLEDLRRREGAERIRDRGARLADPLGELLLGEVVRLHQQLVRARGLDRVEVGALQVLDERELEAVADLLAHDRRDRRLPRAPRGPDPAVAGAEPAPIPGGRNP